MFGRNFNIFIRTTYSYISYSTEFAMSKLVDNEPEYFINNPGKNVFFKIFEYMSEILN